MSYRVHVRVMPRAGLLDPQGQAVEHALGTLGFEEAGAVRVGRAIEVYVRASSPGGCGGACPSHVRPALRQPGHRGLHRRGGGRLMQRVAVVRFPGSNCDYDSLRAARARRRRRVLRLAPGHRSPRADVVHPAGGVQLRRLPPRRRHRSLQPRHAGGAAARRGRRRGIRDLQRLPDPVRGGSAARGAGAERGTALRVEAGRPPGRAHRDGLHVGVRGRVSASGCRCRTARGGTSPTRPRSPCWRARAGSCCAICRRPWAWSPTRTARPATSRGSATRPAPSSASCRIPDRAWTASLGSTDGMRFFTSMTAWQPAAPGRS